MTTQLWERRWRTFRTARGGHGMAPVRGCSALGCGEGKSDSRPSTGWMSASGGASGATKNIQAREGVDTKLGSRRSLNDKKVVKGGTFRRPAQTTRQRRVRTIRKSRSR